MSDKRYFSQALGKLNYNSRTQFGLNNLRTCIAFDLLKTQLSGINKLNEY